ncbi:MAG: SAM hydrolase/SAM-dependent halogenase family protein [Candidatus Hodarchaeales archaeon]
MKNMIAILTDFGQSEYLGAMKGVILSINPGCTIVDLYNDIRPQNVKQASFILRKMNDHFPKGTVFLCVVDPGVGTARKAVAIETKTGYLMVGPDNGLFWPLMEDAQEIIELTGTSASTTFQGLDIFAPAAARLSKGDKIKDLGKTILLECKIDFTLNPAVGLCELVHVDHFGNLITNFPLPTPFPLSRKFTISIMKNSETKVILKDIPFVKTYNALMDDKKTYEKLILIPSSYGTFEIACSNGSAQDLLDLEIGTKIVLLPDNGDLLS